MMLSREAATAADRTVERASWSAGSKGAALARVLVFAHRASARPTDTGGVCQAPAADSISTRAAARGSKAPSPCSRHRSSARAIPLVASRIRITPIPAPPAWPRARACHWRRMDRYGRIFARPGSGTFELPDR